MTETDADEIIDRHATDRISHTDTTIIMMCVFHVKFNKPYGLFGSDKIANTKVAYIGIHFFAIDTRKMCHNKLPYFKLCVCSARTT